MIITLTGPNDFMIKQTLDSLAHGFIQKYGRDGIEMRSGEGLEPAELPSLLQGGSLFSNHRLVVLRDIAAQKAVWEALDDQLVHIPDDVVLIVAESQLDKRTKTYKSLKKISDFREFQLLDERAAVAWLQQQAATMSLQLDAHLAGYLVSRVGPDQWQLSQELSKLALGEITKQRVDELVAPNPQASAFDLLDAALNGNAQKAMSIMHALQLNEDPYRLFGLMASQVQTLAIVASAEGKNPEAIAKEAGIHPFAVKKTVQQVRGISKKRVHDSIAELALLDDRLKSSGADPWLLLRQCVMSIAALKNNR